MRALLLVGAVALGSACEINAPVVSQTGFVGHVRGPQSAPVADATVSLAVYPAGCDTTAALLGSSFQQAQSASDGSYELSATWTSTRTFVCVIARATPPVGSGLQPGRAAAQVTGTLQSCQACLTNPAVTLDIDLQAADP